MHCVVHNAQAKVLNISHDDSACEYLHVTSCTSHVHALIKIRHPSPHICPFKALLSWPGGCSLHQKLDCGHISIDNLQAQRGRRSCMPTVSQAKVQQRNLPCCPALAALNTTLSQPFVHLASGQEILSVWIGIALYRELAMLPSAD